MIVAINILLAGIIVVGIVSLISYAIHSERKIHQLHDARARILRSQARRPRTDRHATATGRYREISAS